MGVNLGICTCAEVYSVMDHTAGDMFLLFFSILWDVVCGKQQVMETFTLGLIYGLHVVNTGLLIFLFCYCFSVKNEKKKKMGGWFTWKVCKTCVLSSILI